MPPRKRVRKPAPKSKSKPSVASAEPSSPPSSPPSATAPESPTIETHASSIAAETPVATSPPPADPSVEPDSAPATEAPAVIDDKGDALNVPATDAPAVNNDKGDALNVGLELGSVESEVAAAPAETSTKKKVVKVVKKIVKKVVKVKAQSGEQERKVDAEGAIAVKAAAAQDSAVNEGSSVSVAQSETAVDGTSVPMEEDALPVEKEVPLPVLVEKEKKEVEADEGAGDVAVEGNEEELVEQDEKEGEGKEVSVDMVVEEKNEVSAEQGEGEGEGKAVAGDALVGDEETQISERQKRRRTEIFVGGLDREVTEEDLRNVFGRVGEIVEVRMMIDGQTGKNKGYAFVRYKEAGQAKQAVSEFSKVEIRGKLCGAAALEGNDTIFLGNIDKKWTKENLIKVLQDIGVEKIDTVTVMVDPHNTETNRGFAFLELESNRDAQVAYKKLSKKDAFGKGLNVKVAWAEPLNDPDEEEMQKVKSVYVECIPSSWDETQVRESFNKFGEIERIVLARNMPSAKRKDFAFVNYTTREAALSCVESFDKEEKPEDSSKAKLKVSLAKPIRKAKQNKGMTKLNNTEKVKTKSVQETRFGIGANSSSSSRGRGVPKYGVGDGRPSTNDFLNPQAAWQQGRVGYGRGPALPDYSHGVVVGKRSYSELGRGEAAPYPDFRGFPRPRFDNSYPVANPSYGAAPSVPPVQSIPYYQRPDTGYGNGPPPYGAGRPNNLQRQRFPPHGSNVYPRY